ncbi:MAG: hypothetical protein PHG80_11205 [Methanoregulaceae archaeon]|nr:hypothetical protein [Methanoregulaceae archaeon]
MRILIHTAEIRINGHERRVLASLRRSDVIAQAREWRREFQKPVRIESFVSEVERPPYEG